MPVPQSTLGVVGGLGPLAGARFYTRLTERTSAAADSEHLHVVLISDPSIPSRVDHLRGCGRSPLPSLYCTIDRLVNAGATLIAIPSLTTHAYYSDLQARTDVPIIDLREQISIGIRENAWKRIGALVTTMCARVHVLDPHVAAESRVVYPPTLEQDWIQKAIDHVKRGELVAAYAALACALRSSWWHGVDGFVVGCTELAAIWSGLEHATASLLPTLNAIDVLVGTVLNTVDLRAASAAE